MRPARTVKLADPIAEQANRDHRERIDELQQQPAMSMKLIKDVALADGVATPIAHGLGRVPQFIKESAPRNPSTTGHIEEVRSSSYDRTKVIVLKATGWGATITVDVQVM
jgi:hypothetical protein